MTFLTRLAAGALALALLVAPAYPIPQGQPAPSAGPGVDVQGKSLTLGGASRQGLTTAPTNNFVERRVVNLTGISGWTTIATITPSSASGTYVYCDVTAALFGVTSNAGFGLRRSSWYFGFVPGVDAGSISDASVTPAGNGAGPQFRVTATGGAFQIQAASSDATNSIVTGFARLEIMLPAPLPSTVTWTVAP